MSAPVAVYVAPLTAAIRVVLYGTPFAGYPEV